MVVVQPLVPGQPCVLLKRPAALPACQPACLSRGRTCVPSRLRSPCAQHHPGRCPNTLGHPDQPPGCLPACLPACHPACRSLPPEWSALTALKELRVTNNLLNGSLPVEFSSLTNLNFLDVRGNHLSGTLPVAFQYLTALKSFRADANNFTVGVPSGLLPFVNARARTCTAALPCDGGG